MISNLCEKIDEKEKLIQLFKKFKITAKIIPIVN